MMKQKVATRSSDAMAIGWLRAAVALWAVGGLVGVPLFVSTDFLGGWRWAPQNTIYDQMMVSIYLAVGYCSARAIRDPLAHASFLWFVVWSSLAHGGVMLFHAATNPMHTAHLLGDVWIIAGGIALAIPLRAAERGLADVP